MKNKNDFSKFVSTDDVVTHMESLRDEEQRQHLIRFFKTGKGPRRVISKRSQPGKQFCVTRGEPGIAQLLLPVS